MAKRHSRTAAQQCRNYEVDNIFEYMAETYINGNFSTFQRLYKELCKISGLTQGMFVGSVADNFSERIEQKIFHCEIVVDTEKVKREEKAYRPIPVITDFRDGDGRDCMKEMIQENYNRIKAEVKQIVADELERIQNDPALVHLLQQK